MRRLSVYLIALILWLCSAIPVMASPVATSSATAESPHELRLGFSDSFIPADRMQRSINADYWHTPSPSSAVEGMPVDEADVFLRQYERSLYSHIYNTGHFFVEYQYRLTRVISVGIDANMAAIGATCKVTDGYNAVKANYRNHIYVWSALPTVRFCYLEHPHVRLYSSLGLGYTSYVGTWDNSRILRHGVGLNVTLLGVQVGGKHVFGAVDLGAFNAWYATPSAMQWMPFSRMLSASIGCRF